MGEHPTIVNQHIRFRIETKNATWHISKHIPFNFFIKIYIYILYGSKAMSHRHLSPVDCFVLTAFTNIKAIYMQYIFKKN